MKKILLLVILINSITMAEHGFAQTNPNSIFDIPEDKFRRQFTVELDRGNKMEISVTNMSNLGYISNIDSIVKLFLHELSLVKDSLLPASIARRVDYNMDVASVKKLRIRKTAPAGGYYAFINGSPAVLKIQQDTIVIHSRIPVQWLQRSKRIRKKYYGRYYFSVSFYLNDIDDLYGYRDGRLNEKIMIIQQHYKDQWQYRDDDRMRLKKYPEITSNTAKGYIFNPQFVLIKKSVEIQNYKNRFIPSVSLLPVLIHPGDFVKREIGLMVEAAFSFESLPGSATGTHVNLFTGISYHASPYTEQRSWAKIYPDVSLSYLLRRSGEVYDKYSFRLGLGKFSFGNLATTIQPAFYFNRFLKNVTPSLRIVQRF